MVNLYYCTIVSKYRIVANITLNEVIMKKSHYSGLIIIVALFLIGSVLTSCAGPADEDIELAQQALDDALSMGADDHSPRKYDKARQLLAEAKTLNSKGEFKKAKNKAELATLNAEKALEDAERLEGNADD